ncbi:MAG: acyl-[acyl-carrier-protein] thioesterase, partial [Candidatus Aminicenantales bacterium]
EIADANGGPVLTATSSWMIIGLDRKQPLKVDDIIGIPYAVDKRILDDPFASLPVPSAREAELRFRVESVHIDWNRHVNNAIYAQWALEAVPAEVLRKSRPVELEISYRAEAFYGEEVLSVVQAVPRAGAGPVYLHQILNAASGMELTRLRTRWE